MRRKIRGEHGHEMTKHRVPVQRIGGGCPWKRGRGFFGKNADEKKEGCGFGGFQRHAQPFMKFVSEQIHNAKDFFSSKDIPNELHFEMLTNLGKCEKQTEEPKTTCYKKEDIEVEDVPKEEKKSL